VVNLASKWKDIAELIGITAIVLSLVFVGLQLRQSQLIAQSDIALQELESTIEAHGQINDYVDVWVSGLAGKKLSDRNAVIFDNLLVNVNDVTWSSASNYTLLGDEFRTRILISHFAGFLHQNPGARRVWEVCENRLKSFRQAVVEEFTEGRDEFDYTGMVIETLEKLDQVAKQ
jgi:hypothetical protein